MKRKGVFFLVIMLGFFSLLFPAAQFSEQIIVQNSNGANAIAGSDFNGDGEVDIIYTCFQSNHVQWLENDGSLNFSPHMIVENLNRPRAIDVYDIDKNGTSDFVLATRDKISWFSNNGAGIFTEHVITTGWSVTNSVLVRDPFTDTLIDINSDGEVDILATTCSSGVIGWFENDGSENFTEHIIKDNWTLVSGASAADIDSDGDVDIFAAAQAGGIWWFENDGSESFTEHLIFNGWDKANRIQAGDIDGNGDMDFVATSCGNSAAVGWFENDGSENFTYHPLKNNFSGVRSPILSDIDADGDVDIFATAWQGSITIFFDNDGNENFNERIISTDAFDLLKLFVVDLDSDGDPDILGGSAVYANNHIRWWENIDSFIDPDFTADIRTGHYPLNVNFIDQSYSKPDVDSWEWDFNSDGIIDSYNQNPNWIYNSAGIYSVTLITSNSLLTDTCIKDYYISVFDGESALRFDEDHSSSNCLSNPGLNITDSLTIEAWINPSGWGPNAAIGYGTILDKGNFTLVLIKSVYGNNCLCLKMNHEGGVNSMTLTPDSSIYLNGWQHIAVTYGYEDSSIKMFINGIEQSLSYNPAPSGKISDNLSNDLSVGYYQSFGYSFDGIIDEVRLWNLARSAQDIQNNMGQYLNGNETGLVGYWKMNEAYGDSVFDNSLNTNNFCIQNTDWVQGTPFSPTGVSEEQQKTTNLNYQLNLNCTRINSLNINISFTISSVNEIVLSVYDIQGREIEIISKGIYSEGMHNLTWDASDVTNGQYFIRLSVENINDTRKIILIK